VLMVVVNCVLCGLCVVLGSNCSRVVMGINYVKDGVGPDGVFVVDLVVGSCFFEYMKSLNCIHKSGFFWLCRVFASFH